MSYGDIQIIILSLKIIRSKFAHFLCPQAQHFVKQLPSYDLLFSRHRVDARATNQAIYSLDIRATKSLSVRNCNRVSMAISCLPVEAATFSRFYLKWLHESVDRDVNPYLTVISLYLHIVFARFYSVLVAELSRTMTLVVGMYLVGLVSLN